jgi:DNA-binding transcriptional LysR family regulator
MNTQFFKYALEVERTRSITQAAENLLIAQPNLSKAIREAEDSLGYEIFERNSRGVVPTAKGAKFLEYARGIVQQLRKMEEIAAGGDGEVQRLSVSMPRGSYISRALALFAASLDRSKGIELNITETSSMQTVANVLSGSFRLGIIRYQTVYEKYFQDYLEEKELGSDPIWSFSYVALMPRDHALAERRPLHADDLADSVEIVHGDRMVPYLTPEKAQPQFGPAVRKRIFLYERANQFELLCHMPDCFMWVSPIPKEILDRYGLVQRRCSFPNNSCKDVLIRRRDYAFTELDKRFIDRVYEAKNEVAFRNYD